MYSEAAKIGVTAVFCFLVIADLVGNSLVCAVVLRNRVMRTPMNYLLVNLAAADMTVAVFIAAGYIFPLILPHPKGTAGVCKLITGGGFVWIGALASAFSLVCIALERYLAIKFPYNKRQRITTTKLKHIVLLVWVLAVSWNIPPFLYARYDPIGEFCLYQWPSFTFSQIHSLLSAIVYGVLPITVMIYLYSKLVHKLWFRPTTTSTMAQQNKLRYCKKSARLAVMVSVIYCICWTPVLAVYVFSSFSKQQISFAVHLTTIVLVTLNSTINPVLYSWQSDRFRKYIVALLPFPCTRQRCGVSAAKEGTSTDKDLHKASGGTEVIQFVSRSPMA